MPEDMPSDAELDRLLMASSPYPPEADSHGLPRPETAAAVPATARSRTRATRPRPSRWGWVAPGFAVAMTAAIVVIAFQAFAARPSPVAAPAPTAMATASTTPDPLPACEKYASSPAPTVAGGDAIVRAISRAELPAGVVFSPGVQVVDSAATPGMYDAIVHVCSMPLTRAELIRIGDSAAASVNADPSRSKLATLTLQSWVQIGTDAAAEDPNTPSISLDFQNYAGSSPPALPDSAWH